VKFQTEFNSVSHGSDEFVAEGGVVEIPDELAPAFAALVESGELVPADVPAEKPADVPAEKPADVPAEKPADVPAEKTVDEPKKKGKKE
jgi:hypothetical protein